MADWAYNTLVMKKESAEHYLLSTDENRKPYVDFNKLIPWPEGFQTRCAVAEPFDVYVYFSEKFTKSTEEIIKEKPRILSALVQAGSGFFPDKKLSMEDLENGINKIKAVVENYFSIPNNPVTLDDSYAVGKKLVDNYIRYNYVMLEDWLRKNWGTTKNTFDTKVEERDKNVRITFKTKGNIPQPVISKLASFADFQYDFEIECMGKGHAGAQKGHLVDKKFEHFVPEVEKDYEDYEPEM